MNWNSVKESLPIDNELCFLAGIECINNDGYIIYFRTIGWLCKGTDARKNEIHYWIDWNHESLIDDVTHWMQVPDVPPQIPLP